MIITIALFGIMVMISCTHKPEQVIPNVSFSKDIIPIFQASCTINGSCHLGANNVNDHVNLDSSIAYNTIISQHFVSTADPVSSILYSEIITGYMPKAPYSALSSSQANLILDWIKQGARNN